MVSLQYDIWSQLPPIETASAPLVTIWLGLTALLAGMWVRIMRPNLLGRTAPTWSEFNRVMIGAVALTM